MSRTPAITQSIFPYHVGGRCINRDWFAIPMPTVWEVFSHQLYFIHHAFEVRILSFVLMSNHFHLIIRTPNSNLSEAMRWLMGETSRMLTRAGNRINQTFGGRYFRCLLSKNQHFLNTYKYVYANPLVAKMCLRAEDYPYSTLNGLLGRSHLIIPVEEDLTLFSDFTGTLDWINRPPDPNNWEAMRKAIRRKEFTLPKINRKLHPLESDTL
jgi:REP element-mobilizing transposase RayT